MESGQMTRLDRAVSRWRTSLAMALVLLLGMLSPPAVMAQVSHRLNGNGSMGLAGTNGKFSITVNDLEVKVPGGYVRINRDYDGSDWGFNRQWSGLGHPERYQSSYVNLKTQTNCTTIDGVKTCDKSATASTNVGVMGPDWTRRAIIPGDIYFGRSYDMTASPLEQVQWAARKGVMFERDASSAEGTGSVRFTSTKYPRFTLMQQKVPALPPSTGPDAHPIAGRPGKGGVATREIDGYRWADRTGEWIEYDQFGRITSYGDRNDVRVWFQYGNQAQVERVLDDNGRTVFTLLYKGNGRFITEARDHTPINGKIRRVQYSYDSDGFMTRVIDARGGTTRYEYDNTLPEPDTVFSGYPDYIFKKISKVIDAEGRPFAIEYGMTSRATKFTAADGGVTEFEYSYDKSKKEFSLTIKWPETAAGRKLETRRFDMEGRLVSQEVNGKIMLHSSGSPRNLTYTDERGNSTSIVRDAFDQITNITYADGTSLQYVYEAASSGVREFVNEQGDRWAFVRDSKGNVIQRTAAVGKPEQKVTRYIRDEDGRVARVIDVAGKPGEIDLESKFEYDANDNVAYIVDGEGKTWGFSSDSMGNTLSSATPLGYEWKYSYNEHGDILEQVDPNGTGTLQEYDATGRLISAKDGRGKVMRFGYDAAGRSNRIISENGAEFVDQYDASGLLVRRTDELGNSALLEYDALQRLRAVEDGEGYRTQFDYSDVDGVDRGTPRPSRVDYPTFKRQFRYSNRNRAVQQVEILGQDALVVGATHDARGRIRTQTDPDGNTQSFEYDAHGRVTTIVDELGNSVGLEYDQVDNLIAITDARGNVARMTYDRRGLLTSEVNQLGEVTRYEYDDDGDLISTVRPNGRRLERVIDGTARVTRISSVLADGSIEARYDLTWDGADNLVAWASGRASAELSYDDSSRLIRDAVTIDGVKLERSYTYYENNQVRSFTGPDGVAVTYHYNANGDLSRVDIPGEGSIAVAEWNWTAPVKTVLPGGTVQEMTRDGHLRLTGIRVRGPAQNVLFELESSFGKMLELKRREVDGKGRAFDYDAAVRLIKSSADFVGGSSQVYVLDAAGNRIEQSSVSGTSEFDAVNRLIRRGSLAYAYDAAGNQVLRTDASLSEPLRTTRYEYDGFNRMVAVRDGAGDIVARYAYDPLGFRIVKEVMADRNGAVAGKTLYLHGEEGLLAEVDAASLAIRSHGWTPGQDYSTAPLFMQSLGQYYYYHNDHLGTPWRVTNKAGAIVWSADDYTDFGTAKVRSDSSVVQPWRFAGQYLDQETGLHYNQQRYYDSETGRYISEDPLGFNSDPNFYAYARHSPTNLIDPDGEFAFLAPLAWNYLRCVAVCAVVDLAGQALLDPCNIDVGDAIKSCLVDCIFNMLRIPSPCNRKARMAANVAGVVAGAVGSNSFTGDTKVATPNGLRDISDLRPGDEVLAYSELEEDTRTELVTDLILSHREQTIVSITLEDGSVVEATGGHPIHTPDGWRAAQLLQAGASVHVRNEDGSLAQMSILDVQRTVASIAVYNLEVSNSHTFYVGDNGVLVHNAKRGPKPKDTHPDEPHNKTIRDTWRGIKLDDPGAELEAGGWYEPEKTIPTPCGKKSGRRPDILYTDGKGQRRAVNVGRTDKHGEPLKREREAMKDLNDAGIPTEFVRYD